MKFSLPPSEKQITQTSLPQAQQTNQTSSSRAHQLDSIMDLPPPPGNLISECNPVDSFNMHITTIYKYIYFKSYMYCIGALVHNCITYCAFIYYSTNIQYFQLPLSVSHTHTVTPLYCTTYCTITYRTVCVVASSRDTTSHR